MTCSAFFRLARERSPVRSLAPEGAHFYLHSPFLCFGVCLFYIFPTGVKGLIIMVMGNFLKNGSLLGYFVHPRGKISNLVFKWIFGCTVAKICYIKQNNSRNTQKRPNKNFCKNLHWIVCANLINLQKKKKKDKQTVFEVYLTLTMPLNHVQVFRFLLKYGGT